MIKALQIFDMKALNYINKHWRNSFLDKLIPIITALGNLGLVWIVISLYLIKRGLYKIDGFMVLSALVLTTTVGEGIIKHLIRRGRPFVAEQNGDLLIAKPITYSFPSGHTASSFAAAGIFILTNNPLFIYVTMLAVLIAFSRLYLNVHYPTDVVSGIVLGLICSNVIVSIFNFIT